MTLKSLIIAAFLFLSVYSCTSTVEVGEDNPENSNNNSNNSTDTTDPTDTSNPVEPFDPLTRNISCTDMQTLHPNWVFCDDFEDGTWLDAPEWDASPGHDSEGAEAVRCDSNTFGFLDKCSAYSGTLYFDDEWGYDNHFGHAALETERDEFYMRLYVYFSNPYTWGDTSDKGIYFEDSTEGGTPNIKIEFSSYGDPDGLVNNIGKPNIASYSLFNERRFQNQGKDISWEVGKWYLVEFYVRLNTPGQPNGIARFWIDEVADPQTQTLRLEYTNLEIRDATKTNGYNSIHITDYHQRCDLTVCPETVDQWVKWDNLVVSTTRIGP